jgi:hypothetical protein
MAHIEDRQTGRAERGQPAFMKSLLIGPAMPDGIQNPPDPARFDGVI